MLQLPVYLDNNATTPMDPRVLEAMLPYLTNHFGNAASSSHAYGWQAKEAVDIAREQVAALIHAEAKEIIFTSGATEADNLALKGVYEMYASKGNHIITVATEHKAGLDSCKHIEKFGGEVTYLPVKNDGLIDIDEMEEAIKPSTIIIAVMLANNETGVIQPLKKISAVAKKHNLFFFTDAAQAAGKIPVDVKDGIDLLALSAHKMYGPKGIGALYVRSKDPRVRLTAQVDGGGHEKNMRSGTLNVPAIVGFGKACELCAKDMERDLTHTNTLRNTLENALLKMGNTHVNGTTSHRLPNVCNISFENINGSLFLSGINKNIAVSSGSACTSASVEPSYVLKAMNVNDELAHASIRFGLGRFTTEEEIDYAIEQVYESVAKLRELSPG